LGYRRRNHYHFLLRRGYIKFGSTGWLSLNDAAATNPTATGVARFACGRAGLDDVSGGLSLLGRRLFIENISG